MGVTVRQKVKGKGKPWWIFINHNGERQAKKVGKKGAAEAVAEEIEKQIAKGDFQISPKEQAPTFGEYARKWFDGYGETHLKYSTHKGYDSILRIHLATLLDRPINEITRADLKDLIYGKLKGGLSPATVTRIKALFSVVLSHALEDGLIVANPASGLGRMIKGKERKADVNPLTREEARTLLEVVEERYPKYYPFFLCALRTGMRLGELLALEWGDIDFRGGFIEVRRAHVYKRITTPKNGKTRRVDMSPQLAETFKALLTERKRGALASGRGEVGGLVFTNGAGRVMEHANLRTRVFWPALAKAGLRRIRLHDLRHTFASMLIQNSESLAYVRDQLGHHSIQITVDTYGHLVPGANRQAVARLDDDVLTTYGQKAGCV
ncbi:MAG: tyrosine-type recombinase/integrase [Desulfobaccales bacterium]